MGKYFLYDCILSLCVFNTRQPLLLAACAFSSNYFSFSFSAFDSFQSVRYYFQFIIAVCCESMAAKWRTVVIVHDSNARTHKHRHRRTNISIRRQSFYARFVLMYAKSSLWVLSISAALPMRFVYTQFICCFETSQWNRQSQSLIVIKFRWCELALVVNKIICISFQRKTIKTFSATNPLSSNYDTT